MLPMGSTEKFIIQEYQELDSKGKGKQTVRKASYLKNTHTKDPQERLEEGTQRISNFSSELS